MPRRKARSITMMMLLLHRSIRGSLPFMCCRRIRCRSGLRPLSCFHTAKSSCRRSRIISHSLRTRSASSLAELADVGLELQEANAEEEQFIVTANFQPVGDQPAAIEQLVRQLREGDRFSVLRGITGTGKTLVMAHMIAQCQLPTLVLVHNKTLAAQLARELRSFLKKNAVELFVSYYNYYLPESFKETTSKYVAKKSSVNEDINALRHCATRALMTRKDVVVVASVSCIYGLGLPKEYLDASLKVSVDDNILISWEDLSARLSGMLYQLNTEDQTFSRGQYQVTQIEQGPDKVTKFLTLWPPDAQFPWVVGLQRVSQASNDTFHVKSIRKGTPEGLLSVSNVRIFPTKHHVVSQDRLEEACLAIEEEMHKRVKELVSEGKRTEADRLQARVVKDLCMLRETSSCSGVENYSRHLAGRPAGAPPETLLDYFSILGDWMLFVDESHVTVPQLKAMYAGDQSRKRALVKHGYRLPSALDNRPLKDSEFWEKIDRTVFVSATPGKLEVGWAERAPVDMVIRPTFVCDPIIHVRPTQGQLADLLQEVKTRAARQERTLAVALTKRDAEDLASYLRKHGVKSEYIHSELTTQERSSALRKLQHGEIDCLVGVNLLREGLDLPQVSLVAIMNADCEGFLRSETALLQVVGRAARNVEGTAVFYANRVTDSMQLCIKSTLERRKKQLDFNNKHGCTMRSTQVSSVMSIFDLLKDKIEAEQSVDIFDISPRKLAGSGSKSQDDDVSESHAHETVVQSTVTLAPNDRTRHHVETSHLPTSCGVYMWRDRDRNILYIGKAKNLRSRVRSYLAPNARHSPRINAMLMKAASVDVTLTHTEREALILESNLIKHHQPNFNVLLKDDECYPYICAHIGDRLPRFSIAAHPGNASEGRKQQYTYYGPYTSWREINHVMDQIESKYGLRETSFLVRHGSVSVEEYCNMFQTAHKDVFGPDGLASSNKIARMRSEFESGGAVFDSKYNRSRDVVVVAPSDGKSAFVYVVQFREGLIAGSFSYCFGHPFGDLTDDDCIEAIVSVLERRHYPAGEKTSGFSWFPDEILLSHLPDAESLAILQDRIVQRKKEVEPEWKGTVTITGAAKSGPRKKVDCSVLTFCVKNAVQAILEGSQQELSQSRAEAASRELAAMLSLDKPPSRIECYDISHSQGGYPVGSRVVFLDGAPARNLYRKFNIRSVDGIDDCQSIEEVLNRRIRRAKLDDSSAWALPDLIVIDGGLGQLSAACKVLRDATVNEGGVGCPTIVPVCALAKNQELVFVPGKNKPVNSSPDSPGLLLLRALRDESHRFALNAHRKKRAILSSHFPS